MKKLTKIVALFSMAMLCLLPILGCTMTAEASQPTTWFVKYVDDMEEWRFQRDEWKDDVFPRELYYMQQDIKDGDIIVIDGTGDIELTVDVRLSNLTVMNPGTSIVTAKSIDDFYAIKDSTSAINCDVTNAYVYDKCAVNLNKNVAYLEINSQDGPQANVGVVGTVGRVKGWNGTTVSYEVFSVKAGKLLIEDGEFMTAAADFTTTPSAAPATPSAPAAPSTGEYDDVPKTGSFPVSPLWLLGVAAICMIGSYELKRR